jgi:hypothetical protein
MDKHPSLFWHRFNEEKRLMTLVPNDAKVNVIKLFTVVSYEFFLLAGAFVLDKLFQPSLMFVGKAGAHPIEEPFR